MVPFEQQWQFTSIPEELYTLRLSFPEVGFLILILKFPSDGLGCTNMADWVFWFILLQKYVAAGEAV
jgi:hypothetical protein